MLASKVSKPMDCLQLSYAIDDDGRVVLIPRCRLVEYLCL